MAFPTGFHSRTQCEYTLFSLNYIPSESQSTEKESGSTLKFAILLLCFFLLQKLYGQCSGSISR
jgi:hypothetical protein